MFSSCVNVNSGRISLVVALYTFSSCSLSLIDIHEILSAICTQKQTKVGEWVGQSRHEAVFSTKEQKNCLSLSLQFIYQLSVYSMLCVALGCCFFKKTGFITHPLPYGLREGYSNIIIYSYKTSETYYAVLGFVYILSKGNPKAVNSILIQKKDKKSTINQYNIKLQNTDHTRYAFMIFTNVLSTDMAPSIPLNT